MKPVLERLATDPDMDVKYFAQEAISGKDGCSLSCVNNVYNLYNALCKAGLYSLR